MVWSRTVIATAAVATILTTPSTARSALEAWTSLGLGGNEVRCVAVSPADSNLLLAGGNGLYRSDNTGSSWTTSTGPTDVHIVTFSEAGTVAWAGCWGPGAFRSTDGGQTWEARNAGLTNQVVLGIAVSPADDDHVFATTEHGLFESTDAGVAWTPTGPATYTSAVAFSPADPTVVMAGNDQGLVYSDDSGTIWQSRSVSSVPVGASPQWITFDPVDPDIVYVSYQGFGGTFVSLDAGVTWSPITPGLEGFTVAVDRTRPGFVYSVGGWTDPARSGQYGLDVWTHMSTAWDPSWFARGIAVDPNGATVYAANSAVGVARWEPDVTPPADMITDLAANASPAGVELSWTPPGGDVARLRIYRSTSSGTYPLSPAAALSGGASSWTDVSATAGTTYFYVIEPVDAAENAGASSNEVSITPSASVDLVVSYIERTPHDTHRYQVEYTDYDGTGVPHLVPGTEGDKRWPNMGETVTFVGHVINKGNTLSGAFDCTWKLNGAVVEVDRIEAGIVGFDEATVSLDYVWPSGFDTDHSDVTVTLEVDTASEIAETYETNNGLTDFVEGLAIYFYTDAATYQAFNERLNLTGTIGFEDWLHAQIEEMNAVFARSVYAGAPNGCLERVRIDRFTVGAPLPSDNTEDGSWYLTGGDNYADTFALQIDNGLLHELMHQLGLIDLYNMNLGVEQNEVVTPDGISTGMTVDWGRPGLMGGGSIEPNTGPETYLSRWDVLALNANCGYRRGYYGEFLYDVPATVSLEVLDASGAPAAGASVRIFQRKGGTIDNVPEITGVADGSGIFVLPNRPVDETTTTDTGHTLSANPFSTINVVGTNSNWLIEVSAGPGDFDFSWLSLPHLNLAYWDGNTASWTHTIESRLSATAIDRVAALQADIQGTQVNLTWPVVPAAESYTVYRASRYLNQPGDPSHQYENWVYRPLATVGTTQYLDTGLFESSRYAVAANLGGLPGPLSNRVFGPYLIHPRSVVLHTDGSRSVIDPQNGYALMRQDATASFTENFGSVHNHLEFSDYMDIDRNMGRLVISHPGDYYTGRQSVKITDFDGNNLLEIGDTGSATGLFQDPAGVAVDSSSRIYVADSGNARLQIFTSTGSTMAVFGAPGSGVGEFDDMRGVAVDESGRVFVCDAGNDRLVVLSFDGVTVTWLDEITGISEPNGVAVGNGNILVSDGATNAVHVYDATDFTFVRSLTESDDYFGGSLDEPTGVTVLDEDYVLVCDTGNRRVTQLRIDGVTSVESEDVQADEVRFLQPHPTPFHDATNLVLDLPRATQVSMAVVDVSGRRVRTLADETVLPAGRSLIPWDGRDRNGHRLAAGVYFVRVEAGKRLVSRRVVLVR